MKLTIYVCNSCGTIMQMDELPPGWQRLPDSGTRPEKHQCATCYGQLVRDYGKMESKLSVSEALSAGLSLDSNPEDADH